jgi:hypothetical protein
MFASIVLCIIIVLSAVDFCIKCYRFYKWLTTKTPDPPEIDPRINAAIDRMFKRFGEERFSAPDEPLSDIPEE